MLDTFLQHLVLEDCCRQVPRFWNRPTRSFLDMLLVEKNHAKNPDSTAVFLLQKQQESLLFWPYPRVYQRLSKPEDLRRSLLSHSCSGCQCRNLPCSDNKHKPQACQCFFCHDFVGNMKPATTSLGLKAGHLSKYVFTIHYFVIKVSFLPSRSLRLRFVSYWLIFAEIVGLMDRVTFAGVAL